MTMNIHAASNDMAVIAVEAKLQLEPQATKQTKKGPYITVL